MAINLAPVPVLATILVTNGTTATNKVLAGISYVGARDDGAMDVSSGGTAINTTIHNGGYQHIYAGATASGTTINYFGMQLVSSGGDATSTTINSGGTVRQFRGCCHLLATVTSGGKQYLYFGGQATGVTQNVGGNVIAPVYGNDTQTVVDGNNVSGSFSLSGGIASGFILYGDKNFYIQEVFSGGLAINTTLSGGSQEVRGRYCVRHHGSRWRLARGICRR